MTEDWTPPVYVNQVRLIGGPCDGSVQAIESNRTVVEVAWIPRGAEKFATHLYERQLFINSDAPYGAQEHHFWFWINMPQDERLAAAKARI